MDVSSEIKRTSNGSGYWLLVSFIGCATLLTGYEWEFFGITLTPERIVAAPLFFISIYWVFVSNKITLLPRSTIILVCWLIWGLLASIYSDVSVWSLRMYVVLLIAALYFYVVLFMEIDPFNIFNSKLFILIAWFFGPVLSVMYILYIGGFDFPDVVTHWFKEGSGGLRIRGTLYEPNLFGAFLSFFILIVIAKGKTRSVMWWALLLGLHLSLIFSFSRVPWLAYLSGLFFYLILSHPRKLQARDIARYCVFVGFFAIILGVIVGAIVYLITSSSDTVSVEVVGRIHSVNTRFVMWSLAAESILNSPILGNGVFSLSAIYPDAPSLVGSDSYRSVWISNLPLAILHDTGVIGFILFFLWIGVVVTKSWVLIRKISIDDVINKKDLQIGAALLAVFLSLLISSLSIPSYSLAMFWVIAALVIRLTVQANDSVGYVSEQ